MIASSPCTAPVPSTDPLHALKLPPVRLYHSLSPHGRGLTPPPPRPCTLLPSTHSLDRSPTAIPPSPTGMGASSSRSRSPFAASCGSEGNDQQQHRQTLRRHPFRLNPPHFLFTSITSLSSRSHLTSPLQVCNGLEFAVSSAAGFRSSNHQVVAFANYVRNSSISRVFVVFGEVEVRVACGPGFTVGGGRCRV
jgi:hypothetical protein